MKNKGFTLIELLAVIVILAIIALIAVPIILNIIGDAKNESDKRSIELYGNAVKNAVAKVQLYGTEVTSGLLDEDFLNNVEYDGNEVNCEITRLNTDGTIYLDKCTVNGNAVDYKYGEYKQIYKPDFYGWWTSVFSIGGNLPEELLTIPPEDKTVYLGFDKNENVVLAAYSCFKKDEDEYCLKGFDPSAYEVNKKIMIDTFGASSCSEDYQFICKDDYLEVHLDSENSYVYAYNGSSSCDVNSSGNFYCNSSE